MVKVKLTMTDWRPIVLMMIAVNTSETLIYFYETMTQYLRRQPLSYS
jgi:hypothetical protein